MSESKWVKVNCGTCNKELDKLASRLALYPRSFCGRKCSGEARKSERPPCKAEGCDKPYHCKGYCSSCYDKFRYESCAGRKEEKIAYAKKRLSKIKERRMGDSDFNEEWLAKARERSREQRTKHYEDKLQQDRNSWKKPKRRFNRAKKMALERHINFELTLDEYTYIIQKPCHYNCGSGSSKTGIGVDRLDNSLGYTYLNSVSCCGFCNITKSSNISEFEMLEIVKLLKKLRDVDSIWENAVSNLDVVKNRKALR